MILVLIFMNTIARISVTDLLKRTSFWKSSRLFGVVFFLFLSALAFGAQKYDLVILNGTVISGDGSRAMSADLGILNGKVHYIGKIPEPDTGTVIYADDLYICPGFIDIHNHSDRMLLENPTADNYLLQGVTTLISGNCGASRFPLATLFARLEQRGSAVNFGSYVGHNTVRAMVMGRKKGLPSAYDLKKMKDIIASEMRAGAIGMSTGLTYFPGRYSDTAELIQLAGVLKEYNGLYASHIRSEGNMVESAVAEAIRVGEEAGVRVQISHVKLLDKRVWGRTELITDQIARARQRGLEIYADLYPYTASSASFSALFPDWSRGIFSGSADASVHKRIKDVLERMFFENMDKFYIANYSARREFEGKNFSEILEYLERDVTAENAAELLIEIQKKGRAQGIFFLMNEDDVARLLQQEYTMVASDGAVVKFGEGKPHCRNYGTFPRILQRYVKEKKLLSWEEAVHKMTCLPAKILWMLNRGLIRVGNFADLVIFDPKTIKDVSTFADPHRFPVGIHYVLVNGRIAAEAGKPTGELPGRVLYGPGKQIGGK